MKCLRGWRKRRERDNKRLESVSPLEREVKKVFQPDCLAEKKQFAPKEELRIPPFGGGKK